MPPRPEIKPATGLAVMGTALIALAVLGAMVRSVWDRGQATPAAATVEGRIMLQGRAAHGGVTVSAAELGQATTAVDGSFALSLAQAGPAEIEARATHYLCAKANLELGAGETLTLEPLTLPGGDANGDDAVDTQDREIILGSYRAEPLADSRADVNGDGEADLFDLVLQALNQGQRCPIAWAAPAELGAIGGYVFSDEDQDGQLDSGEPGLDGVTVSLVGGSLDLRRFTDANGHYRFEALPAGSYGLSIQTEPSWTLTAPPAGSHESLAIAGNVIDDANFGVVLGAGGMAAR